MICPDCGSSIFTDDPESVVRQNDTTLTLRCLNSCCGHVSSYAASDVRTPVLSQVVDHTTNLLFS